MAKYFWPPKAAKDCHQKTTPAPPWLLHTCQESLKTVLSLYSLIGELWYTQAQVVGGYFLMGGSGSLQNLRKDSQILFQSSSFYSWYRGQR